MLKKIYLLLLLAVLILPLSNIHAETNIKALANYFDLLVSGNLESAEYLWTDVCRERAGRFGIEYENIPLKIDCYSPIVKDLELMRDYLHRTVKKAANKPRGFSKLFYSAVVNGKLVEYDYYMRNADSYFWLTFPQELYTADWETRETKYFRIRYKKSLEDNLNEISLAVADEFIQSTSKELGLSNDEIKNIEEKKIEYIYCESDKQVKEITGHLVKGTYDMPSNDIISAFFPHHHELVHLLVNIKLKKLPLYSLPLLREGIAVHLGGRWGKAPKTLEIIGEFLLTEKIVSIDSILTFADFQKIATSNIAYSAAGLFTGYLIDKIGIDDYLKLYRELCGDINKLNLLSADDIKQKFALTVKQKDWAGLQVDFRSYLDGIVKNAPMLPGVSGGKKEIYNSNGIILSEDQDYYSVTVTAIDKDTVSGNILFDHQESLNGKYSTLFDEQYKYAQEFSGYRFGIRYDRNEVGVYDYATNHLIAKYIWSLTPSDDYFDDKNQKLYFKFQKDVLPFKLSNKMEFRLLPN